MSTGGSLPYQLRPNKAVERLLFIDLLSRLDPALGIAHNYDYYGFGGPQMEDFRLMHERFANAPMVSLEREEEVRKRQKFNIPHTNLHCKLQSSSDFVFIKSPLKRRSIIWLDYTAPSERVKQIAEFQSLLRRVREFSIVKITLNASVGSLGGVTGQTGLSALRLSKFMDQFGRFFPGGLEEGAVTMKHFSGSLLQVVKEAAAESLKNRGEWRFQPLISTQYADGQTMLTITGLVCRRDGVVNTLQVSELATWPYACLDGERIVDIDVPELTLKERIYVNQLLPKHEEDVAAIQSKLGFLLAETEAESLRKLHNYVYFHKHYPHFGKVAI